MENQEKSANIGFQANCKDFLPSLGNLPGCHTGLAANWFESRRNGIGPLSMNAGIFSRTMAPRLPAWLFQNQQRALYSRITSWLAAAMIFPPWPEVLASEEKAMPLTSPTGSCPSCRPWGTCQICTVPLARPVSHLPSGEKSAIRDWPEWISNAARSWPVAAFHIQTDFGLLNAEKPKI